jgi:hypothetical protein
MDPWLMQKNLSVSEKSWAKIIVSSGSSSLACTTIRDSRGRSFETSHGSESDVYHIDEEQDLSSNQMLTDSRMLVTACNIVSVHSTDSVP